MAPLPPPLPGPSPTRFDLRGRLLGTPVRIHPLFWLAVCSLGWPIYADPDRGSFTFLFLWVFCVLISLLVHEFGHVALGRLFGARLEIALYGLGSFTVGVDALERRMQRLAVRLAGPLAQLLLFAGLFAIPPEQVRSWFRDSPWADALVSHTVEYLIFINLLWPLLNLLPIWPLDGGLILRDAAAWLFGPAGAVLGLVVCLLVSGGVGLLIGHWMSGYLPYAFDPRRSVVLQAYTIHLAFCVFFMVSGFRALRIEYRHWRGRAAPSARPR